MQTNINKAGHFSSAGEANTYKFIMNKKNEIEKEMKEATNGLINFDDRVDIDFNSNSPGDVMVKKAEDNGNTLHGRVVYDTTTGELKCAYMNKKTEGTKGAGINYKFKEVDGKKAYKILEPHYLGSDTYPHVETLVEDTKTGDIFYSDSKYLDLFKEI